MLLQGAYAPSGVSMYSYCKVTGFTYPVVVVSGIKSCVKRIFLWELLSETKREK